MPRLTTRNRSGRLALGAAASLFVAAMLPAFADEQAIPASPAADEIAHIFSQLGDQIYEDCIFELSEEQIEVQAALIHAYIEKGASSTVARRLAATQIQPPKLSDECERMRRQPEGPATGDWATTTVDTPTKKQDMAKAEEPKAPARKQPPPSISLAGKEVLPQWDCAPGVDYVTVKLNGFRRKLTGGEICNPFKDVVQEVPASPEPFRLGYTIRTGRVFVISQDPAINGRTIAWGLSGRDVCRNNPDPDCFAARAIGPLPPGEYVFSKSPKHRVTWGPKTKRHVAAVYLRTLWNKDRFSAEQKAAILKRGNIAIHVRLKGEMSEACIGLEPKGWAYVSSLIKEGRATGLHAFIDEPHPQVAGSPPILVASTFSLTSLFGSP